MPLKALHKVFCHRENIAMKAAARIIQATTILLAAMVVLAMLAGRGVSVYQEPSALWRQVAEADAKGLPKTGIAVVEKIISEALRRKDFPEAAKGIAKKLNLEGNIEGNKPEEKLVRMEAEINASPAGMRPILQAIKAHWFWHYFQQNRWRFMGRSTAFAGEGKDIRTWDIKRIYSEIGKSFDNALKDDKALKVLAVSDYSVMLQKGTIPDKYRPTMFDFLAYEAIGFYASGEQAGAKPEDSFNLEATGPIFDSVESFVRWNPKSSDSDSPVLKAAKLHQSVLSFHIDDKDKTALLDADLHRLRFGWNKATGSEKNHRYKSSLESFSKANPGHELSAMAQYQLAGVLQSEGSLEKAREAAMAGMKAHPDSPGGKLCHNLVANIEAKSLAVLAERAWAEPWPGIKVTYRNINRVHFRVIGADFIERLKISARWRPDQLDQNEARRILSRDPVISFSRELPATADYKEKITVLEAPKNLKPGFYFLFASTDENFIANSPVSYCDFFVTDLALMERRNTGTGRASGIVTNATTGEPVEGALVQSWLRQNNGGWTAGESSKTDKNGEYNLPARFNQAHLLVVSRGDHRLASSHENYEWMQVKPSGSSEHVVFFTDRSIFRPGQTISFKGIAARVDQVTDAYEVIRNRDVSVIFSDPNSKEIARLACRTNDYGSFSGSFTAPRDRLMGNMTIRAERLLGGTAVQVEEYKRPKFKAELESAKVPYKLGDTVTVPGKAIQYNGVPVAGAKVSFRVTRQVRFPDWFAEHCWWRPVPSFPSQEIAHGTIKTESDGSFKVPFVAKPDPAADPKDEPAFRFSITADVTDTNGETRSASSNIQVGHVAMRAMLASDEWLTTEKPVRLAINTATLDGEGISAKGRLKVFALRQPEKAVRAELPGQPWRGLMNHRDEPVSDPSKPVSWPLANAVLDTGFSTDGQGKTSVEGKLPAGIYRALLDSTDRQGKAVSAKYQFVVIDTSSARFEVKLPNHVVAAKWRVEPGREFELAWATGHETGRAFVEFERQGKVFRSFWTDSGKTQQVIRQPVSEEMRGGFTVRVSQVRDNRGYLFSRRVDVPWTNKELSIKWERMVSKMEPGKTETITAVVTGPNARKAVAEIAATMYDSSLDAFKPHAWMERFGLFRQDHSHVTMSFENQPRWLGQILGAWPERHKQVNLTYRGFPDEITQNYSGYEYFGRGGGHHFGTPGYSREFQMRRADRDANGLEGEGIGGGEGLAKAAGVPMSAPMAGAGLNAIEKDKASQQQGAPAPPDLDKVSPRSNLSETAFFFPQVMSNSEGEVRIEFKIPEALTKWRVMAFSHDREMRSGFAKAEVETSKDLMAQPNAPRFLREGDAIEFVAKISNQGATRQKGTARLSLTDARTDKPIDAELSNAQAGKSFDLPAGESAVVSWNIRVPDGAGPIAYKVIAASERLSDGEEGMIPVLSRKILVQESLPMPIRGVGTKKFDFSRLAASGNSKTLTHQQYSLQMTSQPAWYAVMALPYLMENPHEGSEQVFNRLYANAIARHIAGSDPRIRKIFDLWKATDALDSPLEKNNELKQILLQETPWVRQAVSEGQARKNLGILFDSNRLDSETTSLLAKLAQLQHPDGAWPWFPGGPGNDYITLYITTGFGRLRHLGARVDTKPAVKAIARIDDWARKQHEWALAHKPDENHLGPTIALYLYCRSFFLKDVPIHAVHRASFEYWTSQAAKHWLKLADRQSQAHIAVALKRLNDGKTAGEIMASIRERSKNDDELGMHWRDLELSHSWFRAPIETQAMMIEAFDEVISDQRAVEDCKVWLLKNKQTSDWKTTKATADAIYALLLRGDKWLGSNEVVAITVGGLAIKPERLEAGTGFFEQKFTKAEISPAMAEITLRKSDPGVSWGSAHWSYFEDIAKVTPHEGTALKVEKKLFRRTLTASGPVISPLGDGEAWSVGDEVVVRIILKSDRDMEFVHLKDNRGSGTEPVNVLSAYKFRDGLGYYETTRDTASHFFLEYLPKGVYVFEYSLRVQHRGSYPAGHASIQCLYAPEFGSHSGNIDMLVK